MKICTIHLQSLTLLEHKLFENLTKCINCLLSKKKKGKKTSYSSYKILHTISGFPEPPKAIPEF